MLRYVSYIHSLRWGESPAPCATPAPGVGAPSVFDDALEGRRGSSADIIGGQVVAVGNVVAEMFTERNAEIRFSLKQVIARAVCHGLAISAEGIDEVSYPQNTHTHSHTQSVTRWSN